MRILNIHDQFVSCFKKFLLQEEIYCPVSSTAQILLQYESNVVSKKQTRKKSKANFRYDFLSAVSRKAFNFYNIYILPYIILSVLR